jgi:hypothetical protein
VPAFFLDHIRRPALPAVMLAVAVVLAAGCSSTGAGFNARLISPMSNNQHRRCPVALLHWRPPPPSVGPFEEEVRSLENRRIEFSQRPIIFYGSSSIRLRKTLGQDFYRVPGCQLRAS